MKDIEDHPYLGQYTDLLDERVGGVALSCSDEWFAECSNLVKLADPIFRKGHFVDTGQWMDGWESRRSFGRRARLDSGVDHDWCILRLGIPGRLHGVDIETTHFTGNAPEYAALEGAWVEGDPDATTQWFTLLPKSPTQADDHNLFALEREEPVTHLRLKIYPDGGVARLRAWGTAHIAPRRYPAGEWVDLAGAVNGGRGMQCSDRFYSSPSNLLMPESGINMGDGWETKRRRDAGHDWCIVRLGLAGSIRGVLIDTAHFKGNYPDSFTLEAVNTDRSDLDAGDIPWQTVIEQSYLEAHCEHRYSEQIKVAPGETFTHVRLSIFPDGGVSRLRVLGEPDWSLVQ